MVIKGLGIARIVKVGLIGGTGSLGKGLAVRLSVTNHVLIGSRSREKAENVAAEVSRSTGRDVAGASNGEVAASCDAAILAIPSLDEAGFLDELRMPLARKIVVSPIVPISMDKGLLTYSKTPGSAAEVGGAVL